MLTLAEQTRTGAWAAKLESSTKGLLPLRWLMFPSLVGNCLALVYFLFLSPQLELGVCLKQENNSGTQGNAYSHRGQTATAQVNLAGLIDDGA